MAENSFASFKPIISFADTDKERLQNYYKDNGLTPDNVYMENYLGLTNPADTPIMKSTSSKKESTDIGKLLSDVVLPITLSNKPEVIQPDAVKVKPTTENNKAGLSKVFQDTPRIVPKSKKDFIKIYGKSAEKASLNTGISTDMLLAQIALESGWGKHAPGYNLGGIKADPSWKGRFKMSMTKEQGKNGLYSTMQKFRVYNNAEEGFNDYVKFLSVNKRYKPLKGVSDPYKAAEIMGASGYATDANYTAKLKNMIKEIQRVKRTA